MNEDFNQANGWAVIPSVILYDDEIPANAKILYGEISTLTNRWGYCFASNQFFADRHKMTTRSIERLISSLADKGYIRIETKYGKRNTVVERRIYAGLNPLLGVDPVTTKTSELDSVATKMSASYDKNVGTNNIKEININNTCAPYVRQKSPPRAAPDWKPERFALFWKYYRAIPGEGGKTRNEDKQRAMAAWDALRPDDGLIDTIARALLRQLATAEWQRGVGIPMAATYLNNARWEDAEDLPDPEDGQSNSRPAEPEHNNGPVLTGKNIPWI